MKRPRTEFLAIPVTLVGLGLLFLILWAADAGLVPFLIVGASEPSFSLPLPSSRCGVLATRLWKQAPPPSKEARRRPRTGSTAYSWSSTTLRPGVSSNACPANRGTPNRSSSSWHPL